MDALDWRSLSAGAALLLGMAIAVVRNRKSQLPLPPNAPGYPLIGNILDVGNAAPWKTFHAWSQQYGEVISVYILGNPIVVLDTIEATNDLLEKRSGNYSDRPDMPMIKDLMGWTWTFALMRYGARWREHRRVFVSHFHNPDTYRSIQEDSARKLVINLYATPQDFFYHLRAYTGYIIMKRVYGHTVKDKNDPYVSLVDKASQSTSLATKPPGFLVDLFPSLKHVPSWFPGAGFKRLAAEWRKLSDAMVDVPYNMVKDKVTQGSSEPCFVSTCLEARADPNQESLSEELIKNTAAVAYAAGVDTTGSSLSTFVYAMVMFPHVQKRAQAELDKVVSGRLPTFDDRSELPFIVAIVKEALRWIPVLPLGVPHRTVKGDTYKGYWIPPGTTIIPNTWAILHNPEVYLNPSEFNPQRFLDNPDLPDPLQTFGYGRRACAGREMAMDAMFLAVATILSVFSIEKAKDAQGHEITPKKELAPGSLCQLLPFECTFKPRHKNLDLLHI